jgi:hypothetical protein
MGRYKNYNSDLNKFCEINEIEKTIKCLKCDKILKGVIIGNFIRHFEKLHPNDQELKNTILNSKNKVGKPTTSKLKIEFKMSKTEFIRNCIGLVTVKSISFRIFDDCKYFKNFIFYEN